MQEAVRNAVKHSGVRAVTVFLRGGGGEIQLEVADEGVGFDPDVVMRKHGLGLIGMMERSESSTVSAPSSHGRVPERTSARASRYVRPERPLVPLTIKTSAGKLNPWSVEYSLRDSTASRCTSAI